MERQWMSGWKQRTTRAVQNRFLRPTPFNDPV